MTTLQRVYAQAPDIQKRLLTRIHLRLQTLSSPAGKGSRATKRALANWCAKVERSVERYFSN